MVRPSRPPRCSSVLARGRPLLLIEQDPAETFFSSTNQGASAMRTNDRCDSPRKGKDRPSRGRGFTPRLMPLEDRRLMTASIGLNFTGNTLSDYQALKGFGAAPPDTMGAAGLN